MIFIRYKFDHFHNISPVSPCIVPVYRELACSVGDDPNMCARGNDHVIISEFLKLNKNHFTIKELLISSKRARSLDSEYIFGFKIG